MPQKAVQEHAAEQQNEQAVEHPGPAHSEGMEQGAAYGNQQHERREQAQVRRKHATVRNEAALHAPQSGGGGKEREVAQRVCRFRKQARAEALAIDLNRIGPGRGRSPSRSLRRR